MLENKVMAAADPNEQIPTLELSIVMPCLNEAETLATCISKARDYLERHKIAGEVLIADNGSSDGSQEIATNSGARVVPIPERGYGSALRGRVDSFKLSTADFESINLTENSQVSLVLIKRVSHNN
jgi:glycosyltransferase involved in cell wall biosynthesis